jgi:hypothetical protein
VLENKVARDGIEPPTPAFSGLDSPDPIIPISHVLTTFLNVPNFNKGILKMGRNRANLPSPSSFVPRNKLWACSHFGVPV